MEVKYKHIQKDEKLYFSTKKNYILLDGKNRISPRIQIRERYTAGDSDTVRLGISCDIR